MEESGGFEGLEGGRNGELVCSGDEVSGLQNEKRSVDGWW